MQLIGFPDSNGVKTVYLVKTSKKYVRLCLCFRDCLQWRLDSVLLRKHDRVGRFLRQILACISGTVLSKFNENMPH